MKITLWLKLEKASLEQKRGKNVSYSIVLLKSSNETSIKSNVTWIKTMHCINHFLPFHRRQNRRVCIKIRRKNLISYIFVSWVRYSPPFAASRLLIYILMCRRPSWLVSKIKAKRKFTYILQIPSCIETLQSFIHFLNVNKRSGAEGMKFRGNWPN